MYETIESLRDREIERDRFTYEIFIFEVEESAEETTTFGSESIRTTYGSTTTLEEEEEECS